MGERRGEAVTAWTPRARMEVLQTPSWRKSCPIRIPKVLSVSPFGKASLCIRQINDLHTLWNLLLVHWSGSSVISALPIRPNRRTKNKVRDFRSAVENLLSPRSMAAVQDDLDPENVGQCGQFTEQLRGLFDLIEMAKNAARNDLRYDFIVASFAKLRRRRRHFTAPASCVAVEVLEPAEGFFKEAFEASESCFNCRRFVCFWPLAMNVSIRSRMERLMFLPARKSFSNSVSLEMRRPNDVGEMSRSLRTRSIR